MTEQVAFARKATGIVRELGLMDVFLISAACATLQANFLWLFSWPDLTFPGSSPFGICTVALMIVIPVSLVYIFLSSAMPRSGGDYIYTSRILRPNIGFMVSFVVAMAMFMCLGTDMMYFVGTALVPTFTIAGVLFNNASLISLSRTFASPVYTFAIGATIMVVLSGLAMTRAKNVMRIAWVFMALSIIGGVVTAALLLTTSREAFISIWNTKMGSYATYDQIVSSATSLGWSPTSPNIWANVSAMGFGAWLFFGWIFPVYAGGEVKSISKNMLVGILASILFLFVFWVVIGELSWAVAGKDWVSAANWLATNHPDKYPVPSYPWISFVTPLLTDNPILIQLMLVSYIAMWIANDLPKIMVTSRILFSWSFDRILPKFVANVSKRFHAPTWAVIITGTLAIIWLGAGVFSGIFNYYLNIAGMILIAYTIVAIAAVIFPFKLKDTFEASPSIVKARVGKVPVISIIGLIAAVLGLYASYYALTTPVMGPVSVAAYTTIAGLFIMGFVIYEFAKYFRMKRDGIDLGMNFREVPPE